jgi:uncharacterized protein YjbI with pentapeptide repeats
VADKFYPPIPPLPSGLSSQMKDFLWAVKQNIYLQTAVAKAYDSSNIVTTNDLPSLLYFDENAPLPPTHFSAVKGYWYHYISWQYPNDDRISHVEIWHNSTNNRSSASKLAVVTKPQTTYQAIPLVYTQDTYYWIRSISYAGKYSTWVPTDAMGGELVVGSETVGEMIDTIMDVMTGQLTESQLYNDLNDRIDNIEIHTSQIGDLNAEFLVKLTVDDYCAGFGVVNDGATAQAIFLVDTFGVVTPGEDPKTPFIVGMVDGVSTVGMDANLVVDGTILGRSIHADAIVSSHIAADQVLASHIAADQVEAQHIAADQIDATHLTTGCVTADEVSTNTIITNAANIDSAVIKSVHIDDAQILTTHIDDAQITTAKIKGLNVTTGRIADAAINEAKILNLAVTEAKIGTAAVTEAKIGTAAITEAKIQNGAITNAKIGTAAVDTAEIANGAITNAKIGSLAVDTAEIANGAITNAKIADGAVDSLKVNAASIRTAVLGVAKIGSADIITSEIRSAIISYAKIASADIDSASIRSAVLQTSVIYNSMIVDGTIAGTKLQGSTITSSQILNGTITGSDIASSTITGSNIANSTITGSHIQTGILTNSYFVGGVINGAWITNATITNSKLGTGCVAEGNLQSSSVATSKVQSNAITNSENTYAAGPTSCGTGGSTVVSDSITVSAGSDVLIIATTTASTSAVSGWFTGGAVRLMWNSTTQLYYMDIYNDEDTVVHITVSRVAQSLGAGTHTFTLIGYGSAYDSIPFSSSSMCLIELKR